MPKVTAALSLSLPPRPQAVPVVRWLCADLRTETLNGRLRPGARLPASPDLAGQYGISRGTVVSAFEQLEAEGYLKGSVGSGTFVNHVLPDDLLQVRPVPPAVPRPAGVPRGTCPATVGTWRRSHSIRTARFAPFAPISPHSTCFPPPCGRRSRPAD